MFCHNLQETFPLFNNFRVKFMFFPIKLPLIIINSSVPFLYSQVKDWVPRHGAGSIKHLDEKINNWVIEVKPGQDPMEDPFEKRATEKKLDMAKQKMRELRNKAESIGEKLPFGVFGTPNRKAERGNL